MLCMKVILSNDIENRVFKKKIYKDQRDTESGCRYALPSKLLSLCTRYRKSNVKRQPFALLILQ